VAGTRCQRTELWRAAQVQAGRPGEELGGGARRAEAMKAAERVLRGVQCSP